MPLAFRLIYLYLPLYAISHITVALLIGALLTIIEMAIIFTNIMWVEKTNISKSLKGGCL